jgi:hypothetical protein
LDDLLAPGDTAIEGGTAPGDPTAAGATAGSDLPERFLDEEGPGRAAASAATTADEEPLAPSHPESRKQRRLAALGRVLSRKPNADAAAPDAKADSAVPNADSAVPNADSAVPAVDPAEPATSGRMPWRRVSLALSIALAGLLTLTGFLAVGRVAGGSGSPAPSPIAAATVRPGHTSAPSATAVAAPGAAASTSAAPSVPGPRPAETSPLAVVSFHDLVVDSPSDKASTTRTFTFSSDGPGPVAIDIVAASPLQSSTLCYTLDGAPPVCASGGTPGFDSLYVTTAHSVWNVTLVSAGKGSPIVDVQFSWPTDHASITLTHGRLQGAPNPDSLRDLSVTFSTRAAGTMNLTASWPPASVTASLTLNDIGRRVTGLVDRATYLATARISPAYSHRVAAATTYQLVLSNAGVDAGRPDLTATLTFP